MIRLPRHQTLRDIVAINEEKAGSLGQLNIDGNNPKLHPLGTGRLTSHPTRVYAAETAGTAGFVTMGETVNKKDGSKSEVNEVKSQEPDKCTEQTNTFDAQIIPILPKYYSILEDIEIRIREGIKEDPAPVRSKIRTLLSGLLGATRKTMEQIEQCM